MGMLCHGSGVAFHRLLDRRDYLIVANLETGSHFHQLKHNAVFTLLAPDPACLSRHHDEPAAA
jgi:hypothetical protein